MQRADITAHKEQIQDKQDECINIDRWRGGIVLTCSDVQKAGSEGPLPRSEGTDA
jgi:hypothetical protein